VSRSSKRHVHARRAARQQRVRVPFRRSPYAVALAVLAILLGGAGLAEAARALHPREDAAGGRTRTVAVRTATLACPAPAVRGGGASSQVSIVAPPRVGAGRGGAATLADIAGGPPRIRPLTEPGGGNLDVGSGSTPPQVARASEALAPGLTAELVTVAPRGLGRGLSSVACVAPSNDFWFLGTATSPGRRGGLYLTNVDPAPALLDVALWSDKGPIEASGSGPITVNPGEQRTVRLDGLAPGHGRVGVSVRVRSGRVAAALHDQDALGVAVHGSDWITPVERPERRQVLPGVPGGDGDRRLQILPPGSTDAIVRVRMVTAEGSFAPTGLDPVTAKAGRVTEVDLDPAARRQPLSLLLESDQPIVAAVRMTVGRSPADVGYVTATQPLGETAVVADARGGGRGATTLLLTAPGAAARVTLTALVPHRTSPKPGTVNVPAGRTVAVDPTPRGADGYALVVTPEAGSGPVYAARALTAPGGMLTLAPLAAGRFTVPVPEVRGDLSAGLP